MHIGLNRPILSQINPDGRKVRIIHVKHNSLTYIDLSANPASDEAKKAVQEALEKKRRVDLYRGLPELDRQSTKELDFSGLKWGDAEAVQLAAVLPSFARLETLGLGSNQIGDAGAAALAEACRQLPKLEYLGLNENQIGDAGMAALAEAIAKEGAFPSLTSFGYYGLRGNPASDEAKKAVEEALEKKTSAAD